MIKGLAEFEKQPDAVVLTKDRLREDFNQGHFECILAEVPSEEQIKTVGFALYYNKYSTATGRGIYLHDLYVVPAFRGCGLGLQLLRSVAKAALIRHCQEIHWLAFDWNEKAIGFYKSTSVGAHETGKTHCEAASSQRGESKGNTFVNFVLTRDGIARLAS